jgi:hypothetical protein
MSSSAPPPLAAGTASAACISNPDGVFGDVSNLGGCARCDPTNTTCEQW